MVESDQKRDLGAGRVAFLALRDTVAAELAQGWSIVTVFHRHEKKLGIGISQFRSYVRRYVAPDLVWAARKKPNAGIANTPVARPAPVTPAVSPKPETPLRRIVPSVNLKREDLI